MLAFIPACVAPPARNVETDERMKARNEQFRPDVRGPIDDSRRTPADPEPPPMDQDVRLLASPEALERMQAATRLRARGAAGLIAAAHFLQHAGATPAEVVEAIEFIAGADLQGLDAAQNAEIRSLLAGCLAPAQPAEVRKAAAWALRIHGPGAERTVFLRAISDAETRVRWAVVERFGEFPAEADKAQRLILVTQLEGGNPDRFDSLDTNPAKDGFLSAGEFPLGNEEFKRLDRDSDGRVSREEWLSPVSTTVRSDVVALLQRMHDRLTPDRRQINYNPNMPAGTQQAAAKEWRDWAESLP